MVGTSDLEVMVNKADVHDLMNGIKLTDTKPTGSGSSKLNGTSRKAITDDTASSSVSAINPSHDESKVFFDPFCDPENPVNVSFRDVTSAAFIIRTGIEKTPCPVSARFLFDF